MSAIRASGDSSFGEALRAARMARGWRQVDLVEQLGNQFARSTLANVEAGREAPSPRLWRELSSRLPDMAAELSSVYGQSAPGTPPRRQRPAARGWGQNGLLGGPFKIEHLHYLYVFRGSRSPEEIIEIRSVTATVDGAASFGLKMTRTESERFQASAEALWGGTLSSSVRLLGDGQTVYLRRFEFPMPLRAGENHGFAVRSWIERDPEPGTEIIFDLTVPAALVTVQLNFVDTAAPRAVGRLGPLPDDAEAEFSYVTECLAPAMSINQVAYIAHFKNPVIGFQYGVAWSWA